jgi:hypothetical protein
LLREVKRIDQKIQLFTSFALLHDAGVKKGNNNQDIGNKGVIAMDMNRARRADAAPDLLRYLARNAAADRLKAEQRDHAVVLVRQGLKDAKDYPAMFKQIALLEAVATALGVIDGQH